MELDRDFTTVAKAAPLSICIKYGITVFSFCARIFGKFDQIMEKFIYLVYIAT